MKTTSLIAFAAIAAGLTLGSTNSYASTMNNASSSDRMFIREAGYGGNDEIALSKIALQRSTSPGIRKFAHTMIVQHSQAGAQLKMIASSLGVMTPMGPDPAHRKIERKLDSLSGNAFNHAYINDMVKDHTMANQVFQMGATVSNDRLRSFADATLPTIQNHLKMATMMQEGLMSNMASNM